MLAKFDLNSKSDMARYFKNLEQQGIAEAKKAMLRSSHLMTCPICKAQVSVKVGSNICPNCQTPIELKPNF